MAAFLLLSIPKSFRDSRQLHDVFQEYQIPKAENRPHQRPTFFYFASYHYSFNTIIQNLNIQCLLAAINPLTPKCKIKARSRVRPIFE